MSNNTQLRVMVMAGGTGGHVFPALAVVEQLCISKCLVTWLGTRAGIEAELVPQQNIPLYFITIEGVRGKGFLALLKAPLLLWRSISQALLILAECKPQVVLGMGGFASGPGIVAAWIKRIPVIIHEQNAVAGTTNRLGAYFAKRILQAFPDTLPRGEWCGNPVRHEICALKLPKERFKDRSGKLRLLVLGGSRGALAINTLLPKTLALIDPEIRPQVFHQTGRDHYESTSRLYAAENLSIENPDIRVVPFIERMEKAYDWADFVICRAGALTISELMSSGIGALLVPFPFAIDDHQTANGQFLVDHRAAEMIQQADLTNDQLASFITQIAIDTELRLEMAINARSLAQTNAASYVAHACEEIANE